MHGDYIDYSTVSVESRLVEIQDRDATYPHVEGHALRQMWIKQVLDCCRADDFKQLIGQQLDMYCDFPSLTELLAACNTPCHLVRNRLITFEIDHPELCTGTCKTCTYRTKVGYCKSTGEYTKHNGRCALFTARP